MRISILIPAYQEEKTIASVLDRVLAVDLGDYEKEIVVCDDGSSDNTLSIIQDYAEKHSNVLAVGHQQNRGKGAAIRTALSHCTGEYCLVQDADLEYSPEDYPALLSPVEAGAKVVYGSRFHQKKRPEGMQFANFLANRILTKTANLLYRTSITDEATCFKLIETNLLRSLDLQCTGFEFCPEVTAKIGRRKIPIAEVPIQYSARTLEEGKKVRWTDGVEAIWVLLKNRVG